MRSPSPTCSCRSEKASFIASICRCLTFDRPGLYFSHAASAGLGWGFPAALGAQQAAPGQQVVAAPLPEFEKYAEASGGLGLRVTKRSELLATLRQAFDAARHERRQVLVNVIGQG
ncbi:MAG: thiamine pyrophosphate-dependent enzyme [Pseudomonadota bacterium]|nr:thiamine pyrophosphate-dependent enzyme [Pseudomonadota bacterium]